MRRVVLLAFIWGWSFLFIKVAVEGFTPTTVATVRMALGALVLLTLGPLTGVRLPRDRAFWRKVTFSGVVGCAVPFTLLAWGEERISSALTSVAQGTTVLFAAVFSAFMPGERLRSIQLVGIAVGLLGVAVAAGVGADDITGSSIAGVLAAVLAAAAYGLVYTHNARHLLGVPPLAAACGQLLTGAVVLAPFAITTSLLSGVDPSPSRVGALAALGILGTGIAYRINFSALAEVGATGAALVTYLIPPIAVVAGWLVLDEEISPRLLLGLALIIASVAMVRRPATRVPEPVAR